MSLPWTGASYQHFRLPALKMEKSLPSLPAKPPRPPRPLEIAREVPSPRLQAHDWMRGLERELHSLQEENKELRQEIATMKNRTDVEKDKQIMTLQQQNQQNLHRLKQQDRLLTQITNTLRFAFSEYQDATKENRIQLEAQQRKPSEEIQVFSKFEFDDDE